MTRLALAFALLLALALASAAGAGPTAVVYPQYQALLDQYCVRLAGDGPGADTRFDYEQLYVDDHIVRLKRSERLESVRAELFAARPEALSARDRQAWAINTYNFLVIERITLHLLMPVKNKFVRFRSVDEMDGSPGRFYMQPTTEFAGRSYTLKQVERGLVFGDTTTSGFRMRPADPRVALALCIGRVGGPPLAARAYRGDSLEAQLDQAARTTLALPRFLVVDAAQGRLEVGAYLAQQRADYGATLDAIVPFLLKHAPREAREAIRKAKLARVTHLIPGDPLLNQIVRPRGADGNTTG